MAADHDAVWNGPDECIFKSVANFLIMVWLENGFFICVVAFPIAPPLFLL